MANHSDDAPLAWVWSQYRGELTSGAPVEGAQAPTVAKRIEAVASNPAGENAVSEANVAPAPSVAPNNGATGAMLAALILTILGLLWVASTGRKPETNAEKSDPPAVSSETAPAPPPPSEPTAVPSPAAPAPATSPIAPVPSGQGHSSRGRSRHHH